MPPTAVHTPIASATTDVAASDRQLVALAARGEQRSFELLFQRHRAGVHAYALRMLADHAAAEDVVQDVFVSAMRSLRGGTEPVHVRAWLQEIARHACVDHWRGSERRREVSYDAPDSLSGKDARQMAVSGDVAMRGAADRESLACLQSAFQDLPPLQHRVLVQRELEGRSSNEIAERLGISPTAVEGQLARGRRSLAVAFRELQSGERCAATRELCEASLDRPLGVRDRARVRVHLRTCSSCRRHARAAGVEPRLFDPRVLGQLGFLLPIPLLRRFPLSSIFASSESLGAAITSKALVGAAVIAAGGGSALVMSDVGPGRGSDPAPVERSVEPPAAFATSAPGLGSDVASSAVMAPASLSPGPTGGTPEIRLAVATPSEAGPQRGAVGAAPTPSERKRDEAQGAVTPGTGQREALAGSFPTPLTLPRFVPSVPPRVQRLAPAPDGPEYGDGGGASGSEGSTTVVTRSGKQLPPPTAGTKIGSEPVIAEPEPEPQPPVEEPPPAEEPTDPVGGETPVGGGDEGAVDPGAGETGGGAPAPDPGGDQTGGDTPEPLAPAPGAESASAEPVDPAAGEQG
jgi:RNA polymerase sigma-70 factor (ECF subfamily)